MVEYIYYTYSTVHQLLGWVGTYDLVVSDWCLAAVISQNISSAGNKLNLQHRRNRGLGD